MVLLLGASLAFGTATVFFWVASRVARRGVGNGETLAHTAFVVWWVSAALIGVLQGTSSLLASLGVVDLSLHIALGHATTIFYMLAPMSLLFYVQYVYTGSTRVLAPIAAFYLALFIGFVAHSTASHPTAVSVGDWRVNIEYASRIQGPLYTTLVALTVGPLLGALALYASLYKQMADAQGRARVARVSAGIAIWVAAEAVAYATGGVREDWVEVARRLVGLGSTLLVLSAFRPARIPAMREALGAARADHRT